MYKKIRGTLCHKKILVVDDEQSIVTLLKYNLETAGYIVEVAYDGEEALKKLKQNNRN